LKPGWTNILDNDKESARAQSRPDLIEKMLEVRNMVKDRTCKANVISFWLERRFVEIRTEVPNALL